MHLTYYEYEATQMKYKICYITVEILFLSKFNKHGELLSVTSFCVILIKAIYIPCYVIPLKLFVNKLYCKFWLHKLHGECQWNSYFDSYLENWLVSPLSHVLWAWNCVPLRSQFSGGLLKSVFSLIRENLLTGWTWENFTIAVDLQWSLGTSSPYTCVKYENVPLWYFNTALNTAVEAQVYVQVKNYFPLAKLNILNIRIFENRINYFEKSIWSLKLLKSGSI